jgi:hypothetical protein
MAAGWLLRCDGFGALALGLLLLTVGSGAWAQTMTLDNVQPISLSTSSTQPAWTVDVVTGNLTVRSASGNYTQCTTGGGGGAGPSITSFSADPSSVAAGGSTTLTWTTSNVVSCTPTQGGTTSWSSLGTLPANGSRTVTMPNTAGTVTFGLTCTNGQTSVSRTTSVTVTSGGGGGSCAPPVGLTENLVSFTAMYNSWPAYNGWRRLQIDRGSYLAIEFTASQSTSQYGTFSASGYPGDGGGVGVMSISRTPGCFTQSALPQGCRTPPAMNPGISWTNGQSTVSCRLTPGERYYINISFDPIVGGRCDGVVFCGRDWGNIQQQ